MSATIAPSDTLASRKARQFFDANLAVLATTQPETARLLGEIIENQLTWLFARDGSLTARDECGRWWSGTSLPLRVGRTLLKTLELNCMVGCFLSPTSCGQIRAAMEKLAPWQSLLIVLPDATDAWVALHCDDFAAELIAGRLWLACGEHWARSLAEILKANPGLCLPQQYIRTALLSESDLATISGPANDVISIETARRALAIAELRDRWRAPERIDRTCVVTSSRFALWNLADSALAGVFDKEGENRILFDKDSPKSASPLALAMTMENCGAMVAADLFRSDLAGVVSNDAPWITWVTQPRVGAFDAAAAKDRLLLADAEWLDAANDAGWPADRLDIATWPSLKVDTPVSRGLPIAMIADADLSPPPECLNKFSSQLVLWEQIAIELLRDPLVLGPDIDAYLTSRMNRLDMDGEKIDRDLFQRQLILPAWRRGIVRLLNHSGLSVVVFGSGWNKSDEFKPIWRGEMESIDDLTRAVSTAAALIYPSPAVHAHPIDSFNRPILRPARSSEQMIRQARNLLAGRNVPPTGGQAGLSAGLIWSIIRGS